MSIWTKPLFGRQLPPRPMTPVEVRCARMRTALNLERVRWLIFFHSCVPTAVILTLAIASSVRNWSQSTPRQGVSLTMVYMGAFLVAIVWWTLWGFPKMSRFMFDRKVHKLTPTRNAQLRRSTRARWHLLVAFSPAIPILFVGTKVAGIAVAIAGLSFIVSLQLIVMGRLWRKGARLVCAKCDYPLGSWRAAGQCCVECGTAWKKPWGAMFGQRQASRQLLTAGTALLVVSALATAYVIFA